MNKQNNINHYMSNIEDYKIVFILGNDDQINDISIEEMKKRGVVAGVNRIHLAGEVDYLFCLDKDILIEINDRNKKLPNTTLITNDFFFTKDQIYAQDKNTIENNKVSLELLNTIDYANIFQDHIHIPVVLQINNPSTHRNNPKYWGSVNVLIHLLDNYIFPNDNILFAVAGNSLKVKNNHFYDIKDYGWKRLKQKLKAPEYKKRLMLMENSFKQIVTKDKTNIISLMQMSKMNKYVDNISIEELYNNLDTKLNRK